MLAARADAHSLPAATVATHVLEAFLAGTHPQVEAPDLDFVLTRYACVANGGVRINNVSEANDFAEVRLDVNATAELRMNRAEVEFPPNWIVCLHRREGVWIADRIESPERQLADEIDRLPDRQSRIAAIDRAPDISPEELARRLTYLADYSHGNYERERDLCDLALWVLGPAGPRRAIARALAFRADSYIGLSRIPQAEPEYRKALAMADGDQEVVVHASLGIVLMELMKGDYSQCVADGQRLLPLARADSAYSAATVLNHIGSCNYYPGNYREALRAYTQAAEIAHGQKGETNIEGMAVANMGLLYWTMNNDEVAIDYLGRAIALHRQIGNRRAMLMNLRNLAEIETHAGKYALAEKHLTECEHALNALPNDHTRAFLELGRTTLDRLQHRYRDAEGHIARALQLAEKMEAVNIAETAIGERARVRLEQKRYDQAIADAHKSAEMSLNQAKSLDMYSAACLTAGRAYARLGRPREAETELRQSIAAIEGEILPIGEQDNQLFFQDKIDPYYELFRLLMYRRPADALGVVEQARARSLLRIVSQPKVVTDRLLTDSERQEEKSADDELRALNVALGNARDPAKITQLQKEIAQKRLARTELTQTFYAHHPELSVVRGDIPHASLKEVQTLIPPDGAVLEYVVATDESWLVVITHSGPPHFFPLHAGSQALASSMESFANQIARRDLSFRATARNAFDRLIAPAASLIRTKRSLCIIADGPLWRAPFQALVAPDGRFLIERHDIFYAPSLSVLAWYASHRHPSSATHELLAFGNPKSGLAPLPDAEQEVEALPAIYGQAATRVRVGRDATETRLKSEAGDFRILHLATHGTFDDTDPMYSNLVLARTRDDANDGLLEAWEIEQLPLHADLAILSACDTGRGRVRGGEGITGMSWALLAAGCPTAVVSRFAVASESTRALMIAFHRHLAATRISPRAITAALCDAQRKLLRDRAHQHPFHWSAFFVFGQGW